MSNEKKVVAGHNLQDLPSQEQLEKRAEQAGTSNVSDEQLKEMMLNKQVGGPGRPSNGKTVKHNLELVKGGKVQKKQLHIQVYNTGKSYELNAYIN